MQRLALFGVALLVTVTGFVLAALAAQRFPGLVTAYVPAGVLRGLAHVVPMIAVAPAIILAMTAGRRRKPVPVEEGRLTPLRPRSQRPL
jgi:hypothetical protein